MRRVNSRNSLVSGAFSEGRLLPGTVIEGFLAHKSRSGDWQQPVTLSTIGLTVFPERR